MRQPVALYLPGGEPWVSFSFVGFLALLLLGGLTAHLKRRRLLAPATYTGHELEPVAVVLPATTEAPYLWRGESRGIIDGPRWGRAVFEVRADQLLMWLEPWAVRSSFGVGPLRAHLGDEFRAFPARRGSKTFVGLRTQTVCGYFATHDPGALLSLLDAVGFNVTWAEEKFRH